MKKITSILLTLVLILSFASVSMAADQTITVNPLGLMGGVLNAQYEKPLGNLNSLLLSAGFVNVGVVSGFEVGAGYRKYLKGERSGLFAEGDVSFVSVSAPGTSATGFAIQGLCGFKWVSDKGFTVEAGAGGSYITAKMEGYTFGGFGPALRLALGYTW